MTTKIERLYVSKIQKNTLDERGPACHDQQTLLFVKAFRIDGSDFSVLITLIRLGDRGLEENI